MQKAEKQNAPGTDLRGAIKGTNINSETLLATDYLNHFNEPLMILEMALEDKSMLAVLDEWEPLTYVQHFERSRLPDAAPAIRAWDHVEPARRAAFEQASRKLTRLVLRIMEEPGRLSQAGLNEARVLQAGLNALISGKVMGADQASIDALLGS